MIMHKHEYEAQQTHKLTDSYRDICTVLWRWLSAGHFVFCGNVNLWFSPCAQFLYEAPEQLSLLHTAVGICSARTSNSSPQWYLSAQMCVDCRSNITVSESVSAEVFYLQLIYLLLTLSLRKASAGDERQEEDVAHGLGGDAPEENTTSWNTTSPSRTKRAESNEGNALLLQSGSSVHVRRSETFFLCSEGTCLTGYWTIR